MIASIISAARQMLRTDRPDGDFADMSERRAGQPEEREPTGSAYGNRCIVFQRCA